MQKEGANAAGLTSDQSGAIKAGWTGSSVTSWPEVGGQS
jgi:hypothetical protein